MTVLLKVLASQALLLENAIINYEKMDAYRILFTVDVPAHSKKEVSFSAKIEKD